MVPLLGAPPLSIWTATPRSPLRDASEELSVIGQCRGREDWSLHVEEEASHAGVSCPKLGEAKGMLADGADVAEVCRELVVSKQT
jgi:hypothetical protein